ncbi:hypothetical protein XOCgx_0913 [Xanthomonas oryzae pv. oryzicola]|nr:hypothetical protein XOCgx_0913 [Xanthomonas oryzae pv. oryzicola]
MLALSDCMTHLRMERLIPRLPNGLVLRTAERLDEVSSKAVVGIDRWHADACASRRNAATRCCACAIDSNVVMRNAGSTAAINLRFAQDAGRYVRLRVGECFAPDR